MNEILIFIIAAVIQGILEWLPVSSQAFLILIFLAFGVSPSQALVLSVIFHLPTALASIAYFRKEYLQALRDVTEGVITFRLRLIVITTLVSGIVAVSLYLMLKTLFIVFEEHIESASILVMIIIGALMTLVGSLLKGQKNIGTRLLAEVNKRDSIFIGVLQGFAVLPGVTRSGVTLASFLYRKFDKSESLRGTFLLAGPISILAFLFSVLVEEIQWQIFALNITLAITICFLISIITMKYLIKLAGKLNYAKFLELFGLIMLTASILSFYVRNYVTVQ
ncbi:MAG: undecaprenyl-diphosphate phosphatase [Candidatus Korarchaeota archaeon]|nr:undecaprenyl-diphosphate phosphatase [Thermoproteota archaeon]MCR8462984.1 undecaprenyl-diphosphate phosphatase [Thermoproteota archaeon]MCR8471164.1 undecaprenyl-diphosphate phosphatase [Thermoproteota archaeon]MCR8472314.1 undecaprenyl-diphosphate phosphatase [Thermoproteota archaeon]MCR8473417.1 undecaprenyl-diphosphate phosphatase [Thermoproteota archaeon]